MADAPRVLVVGYHAWDVVVPVTDAELPDAKIEVADIVTGGGGPGATAAVALARLGAHVSLATTLTCDAAGMQQRAELERAGVDLTLCRTTAEHRSPLAVILVAAGGGRTIYWSRGTVPRLPADAVPASALDHHDLLYVDGHEPELSLSLAAAAGRRGLPVVYDAGSVREGSRELASACTDVISSRRFAGDLTGENEPLPALRALRELGPERVAMTFGGGGSLGLVDGRARVVRAFAVEVRDTTGAGDAFHAGYAAARVEGGGLVRCLEFGSAVAALKCTDWGGRRGLPDRAAARQLIETGERADPGPDLRRYL